MVALKPVVLALALGGASAFLPGFAPRVARRTAPVSMSTPVAAPAVEEALATAATEARGLAMDSIAAAESGHRR